MRGQRGQTEEVPMRVDGDGPLRVRNAMFESNSYLCATSDPGWCILVDPGLDTPAIDAALARSGLRPRAVFCTHGHFDHVGSSGDYQRRFDIPVYLHRADVKTARGSNFLMMAFKVNARVVLPPFELVDDGFASTASARTRSATCTPLVTRRAAASSCSGATPSPETPSIATVSASSRCLERMRSPAPVHSGAVGPCCPTTPG